MAPQIHCRGGSTIASRVVDRLEAGAHTYSMHISLHILLFSVLSGSAFAVESPHDEICKDFYKFACNATADRLDDGTGVSVGKGLLKHVEIDLGPKSPIARKAVQIMRRKENKYFRSQLAGLYPAIAERPACKDFVERPTNETCLDDFRLALNRMVILKRMGSFEHTFITRGEPFTLVGDVQSIAQFEQSDEFKELTKEGDKIITKYLKSPLSRTQLEKIYERVRSIAIEKLADWFPDKRVRDILEAKIRAIKFIGVDCPDTDGMSPLLSDNAGYRSDNKIMYCNGSLLKNTSEFSLVGTLGHEITHAFDPCNIHSLATQFVYGDMSKLTRTELDDKYPIKGLLKCLRTKGSIGAERNPIADRKTIERAEERNKQQGIPLFCIRGYDQIGESVSDWVGNELLPIYAKRYHPKLTVAQLRAGYINQFRGGILCGEPPKDPKYWGVHPDSRLRANNLTMANPKILEQMNCAPQADVTYCDPLKPEVGAPGVEASAKETGAVIEKTEGTPP